MMVEGGDGLGRDDRLALGGQGDAGAERDASVVTAAAAARATSGSRRALVLLGQLGVAGRRRRAPADRDVGVLGEVERVEAPVLGLPGQLDDVHRLVGGEHGDPVAHVRRHPDRSRLDGRRSDGPVRIRACDDRRHDRDLRRTSRHRHRRGAGHRPRPRARVRPPGRQGRGQRPRAPRSTARAARTGPAGEVVDEIRAMGGEAVANGADVADWDQAEAHGRHRGRRVRPPRRAREQRRLPPRPHVRQHAPRRSGTR